MLIKFDNSGYIDNVAVSQTPAGPFSDAIAAGGVARDHDEAGSDEYTGFRLTTLWQPIDSLDITLAYIQQEIEQDGQPEANLALAGSYQQTRLGVGVGGADRESLANDIDITNLVINYDLGWGAVTSSSSWIDYQSISNSDMSALTAGLGFFTGLSSAGPYYNHGVSNTEKFVQELRLASELDGPFQYVAGLYYEDTDIDAVQTWLWSGAVSADPNPGLDLFSVPGATTTEKKAFFGELSYALSEQFTATLGARYFDYERVGRSGFSFNTNTVAPLDPPVAAAEKDTTYKANLTYTPTEDILVYGQWAEGFRLGSGLLDPSPDPLCDADGNGIIDELGIARPTQLDSDTAESFELGVKTTLADQRITVNAAVYRIEWDGIPVTSTPFQGCTIQLNAGKAVSEGVEIELQAALTEDFRLDASASYGEATLDETNVALGSKGDNLPGSADFNLSLGLEYGFVLAQHQSFARIDYSYIGEYYANIQETGQAAGGFGQLNLKAGMAFDQINVDIFINNVTNADEFTWVESFLGGAFGTQRAYQLRPRTLGLNLSYQF